MLRFLTPKIYWQTLMTLHSDDSFMMIVMTRSIPFACPRPNHPVTLLPCHGSHVSICLNLLRCVFLRTWCAVEVFCRGVLQRCALTCTGTLIKQGYHEVQLNLHERHQQPSNCHIFTHI